MNTAFMAFSITSFAGMPEYELENMPASCHRAYASSETRLKDNALTWNDDSGGDRCCEEGVVPDAVQYGGDWCGTLGKNKKIHPAGKIVKTKSRCWFREYDRGPHPVKHDIYGVKWTCDQSALPKVAACSSAPALRNPLPLEMSSILAGATQAQASQVQAPQVQASQVQTPLIQASQVQIPLIPAPQVQAPLVQASEQQISQPQTKAPVAPATQSETTAQDDPLAN